MIEVRKTVDAYDVYDGDYRVATCQTAGQAERIKRALEREDMTVISFEATLEQDRVIEDTLGDADWRFFGEVGSAKSTADTLVAVLEDWRKRVKDEDETKKNEDAGKRTQIHLRLDSDDHRYIMAAVERRKAWDCEPDSDSCELGTMIAEICRGWMERVEHDTQPKPRRTDNGDGTVTCHGVPVTVCSDVLEGRDVIAVRAPKENETVLSSSGYVIRASGDYDAHFMRVILGPKPQPPEPQFREGGFYRRRNGQVAGPLERRNNSNDYVWRCRGMSYTAFGALFVDKASPFDLIPGEVIVWRHPTSMPADVWSWSGESMQKGDEPYIWRKDAISRVWADWTDPPSAGKWLVREGQEYATWEGE